MSSENFSNELVNGLTITNGTITETDTGPVDPFVGVSPITFGTYTEFAYSGIEWSGFNAGAVAPGSTLALDFQYTVSDTNPGLLITGLQDSFNGSGTNGFTSLTVTENVYSDAAHTHLIGSVSVNLSQESDPPVHAGDIPLSAGYQTVYVDLEVDAIVSASAPTGSQVTFSILDQGFSQSGITVDKEISVDGGTTWVDVGVGNITQDPTVLAGSNIEERVIVVNTGTSAISGASVIDSGGNGPANFTFGGNGTFSLAVGQAATSDIAIISAAPGYQPDTATVSGTVTVASQHVTIGAEDSANYTGETYSAALQKQIDINGTGWIDVSGTGPTVLAGATVAERVIATNTGSVVISDAAVSDSGTGPADFTFGGSGSTVIAVGGSVTSDVATVIASTGYQADTATLSGSVSDSYGDTGTVSATSGANFTGETYSATLQKQIDINGTGWIDVSGTGPTVLAGATVAERVIATNTGSVVISDAAVSDSGTGPADFTFGGSGSTVIAVGGSVTSDVATVIASTGYQADTATLSGSVSDSYGDTGTVSATSGANFTGETYSATLQKQIDINGTGWIDVSGTGPTVLAGATVAERVIATNTGSVVISDAAVSDSGTGPADFTFGGSGSTVIAVGGSVTSDVATVIASTGYQADTATLSGSVSDSYGDTGTVSATSGANFTGETYSATLQKQIDINGTGWIDVSGTGPTVLAGATVAERVIATNTGSVVISDAAVSDSGTGPADFTFGGSGSTVIAVGGSVTSDVATVIASTGYQADTATLSGSVSDSYGDTGTVSATSGANYTGETYSATLQKQIDINGTGWIDVSGTGPTVLAGATVAERVIATNTGSVVISDAAVSDSGTGPADFTFGGSGSTVIAVGGSVTSDVATVIASTGYQADTATLSGSVSDSYGDTGTVSATSGANFTGETYGISIDKQISTDGVNWLDQGDGNISQDPTVAAGSDVYERVILVNTGAVAITNASVSDVDSDGLAGFTFGGASSTVIAVGGTATSDIATIIAGSIYSIDTATVTGSVSDSYGDTGTVKASDIANYTGSVVVPVGSITVDKQISVNGCTWLDVGDGNLSQDPTVLAGTTLYERVIVVNDTGETLNSGQVGDAGSGPSGFTFGGGSSSTFTLGAGQTIVSNVASFVAGTGTQYDTATATGTITVGSSKTTETAQDTAGYIGTAGSITVDKQISVNGCTWLDVGDGNLSQDPTVLAGTTLYERVIVVNDTGETLNSGQVGDAGSGPSGFTFGGGSSSTFTLGAGQTIVSNVASFVAGTGTQYDTATATGTITIGSSKTTETAQDNAGYVGTAGSITVDKQISVDGCTWLDVGNGNLSQDPNILSGTTLYERVIVVNDTSTTLNNGHVVDAGSGPSSFTFGASSWCSSPSSTFTLGAGQTIVSNVASFVAGVGTQYDTATAIGTITVGHSQTTETAQDTAGYVGTLGSITVDKQISVDGCTWLDVGAGNVSNSPTLASGKTLYERVIVVNDTGETLNNGQVTDAGSGPSGFTFGGSDCSPPSSTFTLGAGQTIVSNVASFTATIGTQYDTATATGTITVGSSKTTETAQDDASYVGTVLSNGKITGTVWNDSNDDGQMDCGDTTRGGVTVELLNNGGSVVATTTTNGSGNYSFGSLAGGTYNVEFVAPNGLGFSPPGGASDAGPGGVTAPITITGSQTASNIDAGLVPLPSSSTNLVSCYGKPSQIEFLYQPGNTVSNSQGGQATVSGSNSNSSAFIVVTGNSSPFSSGAYTEQAITSGQDFLTQVAASSSGSKTYIDIFTSQSAFNAHAAPVQTATYVTGGSQAIHLNDTIGSVKVAGYLGQNGGFLT